VQGLAHDDQHDARYTEAMTEIPSLTLLLIAGLATARLTTLIVEDEILEPVRRKIFQLSPPHETIDNEWFTRRDRHGNLPPAETLIVRRPGFVGRLLSCVHCVAVWVSVGVYAAISVLPPYVALPIVVVAAYAQIAEATIKASR